MTTTDPLFFGSSSAKGLSPNLKRGLRAVAVAGTDFEPFVERVLSPKLLSELVALQLVEHGESHRPAVGPVGFRLTRSGWEAFQSTSGASRRSSLVQTA